ncbi:MAG: hypothetical protein KKF06_01430 [Candidatus Margulisbacteria bacterium]|nr:hypothetical protein [Candidatus Margulisiibacteriota bacterium]
MAVNNVGGSYNAAAQAPKDSGNKQVTRKDIQDLFIKNIVAQAKSCVGSSSTKMNICVTGKGAKA